MKSTLPVTALAAVAWVAPASAQLAVGGPTPEVDVKDWFQPPAAGATLEELRGRVVFVEFWATW